MLIQHFEKLLNLLSEKYESSANKNLEDSEYLTLLIIFYSINKFKFQEVQNKQWFKYIFKMHKPESKDYFNMVNEYFSQEYLKE